MATEKAMVTTTTIKQQSTKRGIKTNGGDGDGGGDAVGDGDGNSEGDSRRRRGRGRRATATAMAVMIAGSFSVKTYRDKESEPPNQRSIPLHVHRILFMNNGWGVL